MMRRTLIAAIIPKNKFCLRMQFEWHKRLTLESVKIQKEPQRYALLLQSHFLNSFVVDYFLRQKVCCKCKQEIYWCPLKIPRIRFKTP